MTDFFERRQRRELTEECNCLLKVAETRPLDEARTVRRGRLKRQKVVNVSAEEQARLGPLGKERMLMYKTLALNPTLEGPGQSSHAPKHAPAPVHCCHQESSTDQKVELELREEDRRKSLKYKQKHPDDGESHQGSNVGDTGLEPVTPSLSC